MRELVLVGAASQVPTLTHLHGDHCLGLPGIVQRLALDGASHPVHLHHPASGQPWAERLLDASIHHGTA